jgi:hypothetical protein
MRETPQVPEAEGEGERTREEEMDRRGWETANGDEMAMAHALWGVRRLFEVSRRF